MELEIKEFDKIDWESMAGAEAFRTDDDETVGASPLIGNYDDEYTSIVADRNGLEVHIWDEDYEECEVWVLQVELPHQWMARALMAGVEPAAVWLAANGFENIGNI